MKKSNTVNLLTILFLTVFPLIFDDHYFNITITKYYTFAILCLAIFFAALYYKITSVDLKKKITLSRTDFIMLLFLGSSTLSCLLSEWKYASFTGSSGKSVKIWVRFTYSDDRLPTLREQAELFHAHAYQTAVKYYQPQLPFDIELKEPSLEQYCRLTYDPELYFNPKAMPIYMKQPVSLPSETTFIKRTRETDSPLQRMAPGYENYEALSVLFSAAFNRALEELDGYREGDDLQPLLVCLAEHCFRAGIPEEDTVRWTKAHYRLPSDELLIRETVKSVYRSAKGFGKKSSLTV